ncbi:hypothetical protein OIU77_006875 [Salix suchowensis]|uniref:Bulb-type lectin domain-containing protein n=1 Tax=Salix suchowensis TaxID=1278906 RepID=A0ABQ9AMD2_9ROSI|nr:hypothetical protein OIU77_006875 [Salix suchowensis]
MACAISILLIAIFSFSSPNLVAYAQNDTLKQGQLLRDDEQLLSAGGIFRLGFFSADSNAGLIGTAGARYLGIWFEHIPVYSVWVANRDTPVPDSSGGLTICKGWQTEDHTPRRPTDSYKLRCWITRKFRRQHHRHPA